MPSDVEITAELICSALHRFDFEYMGETGRHPGQTTWFTRGVKPEIIRVSVQRSTIAPYVTVLTEWYNVHTGEKGEQLGQVPAYGGQASIQENAGKALETVLGIYRDVLEHSGVAGPKLEEVNSDTVITSETNIDSDEDVG